MVLTFFIQTLAGETIEFSVQGSYNGGVVQVLAKDPMVGGSYGRAAARVIWASLIKAGGKRVATRPVDAQEPTPVCCRDEDGHDGEDCTCADDTAAFKACMATEARTPPPGTYAYTAWLMASSGMMSGDEADRWKDDMKEGGY